MKKFLLLSAALAALYLSPAMAQEAPQGDSSAPTQASNPDPETPTASANPDTETPSVNPDTGAVAETPDAQVAPTPVEASAPVPATTQAPVTTNAHHNPTPTRVQQLQIKLNYQLEEIAEGNTKYYGPAAKRTAKQLKAAQAAEAAGNPLPPISGENGKPVPLSKYSHESYSDSGCGLYC
jgi:hypothetical protein